MNIANEVYACIQYLRNKANSSGLFLFHNVTYSVIFSILIFRNLTFSLNVPHNFARGIQKYLSTTFAEKWLTSRCTPGYFQRPSEVQSLSNQNTFAL